MLETPVAFLIFNRPDTTRRVFAEIARAKPKKLLVIADGPRHEPEAERCQAARVVINEVDWDCDVLTNFSDVNLGCERRVSSGLDWVFEQCEEAIILEDDCVPHQSFFRFCHELLEHYREDGRVMAISGNNFQRGRKRSNASYYFSRYPHCWGWATWRRAWQHYDVKMKHWPSSGRRWLEQLFSNKAEAEYWACLLSALHTRSDKGTWDYQWFLACWLNDGMCILPQENLVSNIGFREDATHTKDDIYQVANLPAVRVEFPLTHPISFEIDQIADQFTFQNHFAKEVYRPAFYRRLGKHFLSVMPTSIEEAIDQFLRARKSRFR